MIRIGTMVVALTLACLLPSGGLAAPAAVATDASAKAYVQGLYYRYEHEETFGVLGDHEAEVFDSSTLALLRENTRLLNGELGELDSDPLCACQDPSGMKATIETVQMTGANTARANIIVRFGGEGSSAAQRLQVDLAFVNGRWRIHDVRSMDARGYAVASLREILIKENRELSAPAHH